jgi:cytochrome c oxidase subunit IV
MSEELSSVQIQPVDKSKIRNIVRVALILAAVTFVEFVFAFTMDAGVLRTSIFVGLTIVKAYYIVSEFMHLGHERKSLIWSILLPTIFIVWLIIALIYEGGAIYEVRY